MSTSQDMPAEAPELIDKWEQVIKHLYPERFKVFKGGVHESKDFDVDYEELTNTDVELARDLRNNAHDTLKTANRMLDKYSDVDDPRIRFYNHPEPARIHEIRSDWHDRLVCVDGLVKKSTEVVPIIEEAVFECQRCGDLMTIDQDGDDVVEPNECRSCERQGPFEILFNDSDTPDYQKLHVQEPPERAESTSKPSGIDVHVFGRLAGEAKGGDRVKLFGRVRAQEKDNSRTMELDLIANNILHKERAFEDVNVSAEEKREFRRLAEDHDHRLLEDVLVPSFAPTIHGNKWRKFSILLQLFGGVRKTTSDDTSIRGDIHVLLIGDPSTAKSQLLEAAANVAPRVSKTGGKGATAAGLTAAAIPDDFDPNNQYVLEPGVMVQADRGVAVVDELDKVDPDAVDSIHQALEQQEIPIDKGGINTELRTRTSMLAAANPKKGRLQPHDSLRDQVDMSPALMSRFDLIFKIRDEPDVEGDEDVADQILENAKVGEMLKRGEEPEDDHTDPPIAPDMLRKYISYAKTKTPKLSDEAHEYLKRKYVDIRNGLGDELDVEENVVPITARKLEAMVRLAEASARARLSEEVELSDAEKALQVVKLTMGDTHIDENGNLDADRTTGRYDSSQRDVVNEVLDYLDENDGQAPRANVADHLHDEGEDRARARDIIDMMVENDDLSEMSGVLRRDR